MNRNLAAVVLRLSSETVTIQRQAASSYTADGILNTASSPTTSTAKMSVQPLLGSDLRRLPEGFQGKDLATFYSPVPLQSVSTSGGTKGDILVRTDGSSWEVQMLQDWGNPAGYCRAVAMRV